MQAVEADVASLEARVGELEFRRMFNNPMDGNACFIEIQSGAGGTEAQDWAGMLERMYLRYCERKGFRSNCWKNPKVKWPASRAPPSRSAASTPTASCAPRPASTASSARAPSTPTPGATPASARCSSSRGGRLHRDRHQPGRPAHRHLPRLRRRRSAHQQDRLGGAHHPRAHRHRRAVPERPLPAPQQGRSLSMLRPACMKPSCASARASSRSWKIPRATSAGATRSAPTCSTRAASRICAPATKSATPRACSTATWTASSRPASSRASEPEHSVGGKPDETD
jgi:hypothetical protein